MYFQIKSFGSLFGKWGAYLGCALLCLSCSKSDPLPSFKVPGLLGNWIGQTEIISGNPISNGTYKLDNISITLAPKGEFSSPDYILLNGSACRIYSYDSISFNAYKGAYSLSSHSLTMTLKDLAYGGYHNRVYSK